MENQPPLKKTFGKNVARFRKAAGLTQEKFARISNVSLDSIQKIEACKKYPSMEVMDKFAKILNTTMNELLKGDGLLDEFRVLVEKHNLSDIIDGLQDIANTHKERMRGEGFVDIEIDENIFGKN